MAREEFELDVTLRDETRTSEVRRLRRAGAIPGVYYSHGSDAVSLKVPEPDLERLLRRGGRSHLITLKSRAKALGGKHVLIRELQADPVKDNILHVDFEGVSLSEKISVEVPLSFEGTPVGEEEGGKADVKVYDLEIYCRADQIPDEIKVDISHMDVGDVMHAEELVLPEGVELGIDPERTIVLVNVPRMAAVLAAEEAAEAAEEEEAAEPGEEAAEGAEGEEAEESEEETPES